ncbi:hypothetical protein BXZ70DRAFT_398897 [Cristinia sonorae]|uniref:Uncharacterized protein n=1 Tax=Cristinia sonorae TaxID=1940300 RepID=A0A8K0UVH7_9AGAR|nr:hypothetical protein BXZ70DRAFT_398897 [Cristinia sonorae]
MRRLTALFAPKRSSKSDAGSSVLSDTPSTTHSSTENKNGSSQPPNGPPPKQQKPRSGFFRSLSRHGSSTAVQPDANLETKSKRHPMPSLVTDPSSSASSSSAGGPYTPDDDRASSNLAPPEPYRVSSWLHNTSDPALAPDSLPAGIRQLPTKPALAKPQLRIDTQDDSEDDTSSEGSSESELVLSSGTQRLVAQSPLAYFHALTVSTTTPSFSPPPVVQISGYPVYPRSCNYVGSVPKENDLRSLMFKKRLLEKISAGRLSASDTADLAAFGTRSRAPPARPPPFSIVLNDESVKLVKSCDTYSRGLRSWVDRPCFEERMVLYLPEGPAGEFQVLRINGTEFGVAALEFSEGLEAMSGLDMYAEDPIPTSNFSPPTPSVSITLSPPAMTPALAPPVLNKTTQPPVSQAQARNSLYSPSPLRIEHSTTPGVGVSGASSSLHSDSTIIYPPASSPTSSVSTPTIVLSPQPPEVQKTRPMSQPPVKQGVRFAEEEKDDSVPAAYVTRIRQKREEKARFLQREKERRAHEEERRKHEDERRRQEEERRKWEREREAWERERRAMEEERKKKLYAEEVAAARARREDTRMGSLPRSSSGSAIMWDGDREREKERRGREAMPSYLRPNYDISNAPGSRRGVSDPSVPRVSHSRNESPGSSRPPSIGGAGSINGSVRGSSRPPSMYSTPPSSATDIHSRERRDSKASKRASIASAPEVWAGMDRQSFAPVAWGLNPAMIPPVPPLPPVPMMPVMPMFPYPVDMPLLPPTPPFMLQQYGPRKPSSQSRSHSSSPTIGSHRLPSNHSSDRVNQQSSSQPSSPSRVHHERRASGDVADLHKSRHLSGPPAHPSSTQSHDRRSVTSSSNRSQHNTAGASNSSSRKVSEGQRSSTSRPSNPPRTHTLPAMASMPVHMHHFPPPVSVPYATPTPVMTASWTQPAFQNLSRPTATKRQTTIS